MESTLTISLSYKLFYFTTTFRLISLGLASYANYKGCWKRSCNFNHNSCKPLTCNNATPIATGECCILHCCQKIWRYIETISVTYRAPLINTTDNQWMFVQATGHGKLSLNYSEIRRDSLIDPDNGSAEDTSFKKDTTL